MSNKENSKMKTLLENKLRERKIEDLKNDIITAMHSEDESSNIIFVLGLNVLEEKLSEKEYQKFEESL